ncbi:MAG: hypothetical protein ACYTAF_02905, partial [Planctomycetota bacterium]
MLRCVLAMALVLGVCPRSQEEELREKLESTRLSFSHDGTFAEGIDVLRKRLGINIHVDARALDDYEEDLKCRMSLRDVKVSTVLYWLTDLAGLDWTVRRNVIVIDAPAGLHGAPVLRPHTLGTLAYPPGGRTPPVMEFPPDEAFTPFLVTQKKALIRPFDLAELVTDMVRPSSWEAGDFDVKQVEGRQLLVLHAAPAHDEIEQLLTTLKRMRPATLAFQADVWKTKDAPAGLAEAVRRPFLTAKMTKDIAPDEEPVRRLRISCREGEEAWTTESGTDGTDVLGIEGVSTHNSLFVLARIDFQSGLNGVRESMFRDRKRRLADLHLVRLAAHAAIPDGGSCVLALPGNRLLHLRATRGSEVVLPEDELFRPPDHGEEELQKRFADAEPLDVDFVDAPIEEVVGYFQIQTGLDFVIDARRVDASEKVTFQAQAVKPALALEMILKPAGCVAFADREAIRVTKIETMLSRKTYTYVCTVRDVPGLAPQALPELITKTVRPDLWEKKNNSIHATANGILLVRSSATVIAEV